MQIFTTAVLVLTKQTLMVQGKKHICLSLEKVACTDNLHSLVLPNENPRSFKPSVVLILWYKDDEEAEKQNRLSCFCGVNTHTPSQCNSQCTL